MADCQTWTHQVETALVRPTWVRSRIKRFPGIDVGFEGLKGTAQGVARMSGNVTKLKPKQEEAIIALLTNRSVEDAARSVTQLAVAKDRVYGLLTHPTAPALSAALARAEPRPLPGRDWMAGYHVGVEVECKMGGPTAPRHYDEGFHSTGT